MNEKYNFGHVKQHKVFVFNCPSRSLLIEDQVAQGSTKVDLSNKEVLQHIQNKYCKACENKTELCAEFFNLHTQ
ncbi:MAG: hypothetical protein FWF97_01480 [Alphaproteobacteria bacterium]|nr:hypothetical protein [Alphaproteobacteria bacterium]